MHIARKFTLALTLMLLIAPAGRAFAYDCPTDPTVPCVVTGTNPDPQVVTGTNPDPQVIVGDMSLIMMLQMA
jgi:hypothetical protein